MSFVCLLALVGCQEGVKPSQTTEVGPGQTPTSPASLPSVTPTLTPTPLPVQATICLGQEPASLFPYSLSGPTARMLSGALYPGFSEPQNLTNSILESLPDAANSTLLLEPLEVQPGEPVVDAQGELNVLSQDVLYRPAGCQSLDCAVAYSSSQAVQMDQWVLRFHLRPGLKWSDGVPLTASDSVYAYELAKTLNPPRLADLLERTAAYQALDEQTVEWRGLPGYTDPATAAKFFTPLPRHAWGSLEPAALAQDEMAARQPIGYGPFVVASWIQGERIRMVRNPNYFRAGEGLPYLDELDFVFVAAGDSAEQALLTDNGGCDILDASAVLEPQVESYAALQDEGKVKLAAQPTAWEALFLNTAPFDPKQDALFGQPAVRHAAALCIDRAEIARQVFGGLALPASGLSAAQPGESPFDIVQAQALLEQAGWRDLDQDANTPRTAVGVPGVPDGAPLAFTLLVSDEPDRQVSAALVSQGLVACGMAVDISFQAPEDYLASGPAGPVFGRSFAAAQFAWSIPGGQVPCNLFTSSAIPGPYPQAQQEWGGANLSGYANPVYDQACFAARLSLPGAAGAAWQQVEQIFNQDLPAIPLYWRPRLYVSKPEFCGLFAESAEIIPTLSLESLNAGESCLGRD